MSWSAFFSAGETSAPSAPDIEMAEDDAHCLSMVIEEHERIIPNIPAPDVPLPSHLSEEEAAWKRLLLRRVHRLIAEENGSPSSAGIDHE